MFFLKLKKLFGRGSLYLLLTLLFTSISVYAETKTSKSKIYIQNNSSGGKSSHTVLLKSPSITGGQCAAFVNTVVKYEKRRFGEAKLISKPTKNCNTETQRCRVKVSWKHAPVGRLHYWLETTWEITSSAC